MWSLKSSLVCEQWEVAKPRLRTALGDYLAEAEQEVQAGREAVYRIDDTVMLLRGENLSDGQRELVVVGLCGDMAQGTMAAVNHGIAHRFDSIRAHFSKRSATRFIQRKLGLPAKTIEVRNGREYIVQIRFKDMGGSSKSKSSNSTTNNTTNTSGSVAVDGDNLGLVVSGVNDSDINLSVTDHGSVAMAGELAEEAFQFGSDALSANQSALEDSFKFASGSLSESFDFANGVAAGSIGAISNAVDDSYKLVSDTVDGSLAFGGDALDAMQGAMNDSYRLVEDMASGSVGAVSNALDDSLAFASNTMDDTLSFLSGATEEALNFGQSAMEQSSKDNQYAMDAIMSMAGQQGQTTKDAIAMANAAKAREQTGENESNNELLKNISLMVGILGTIITIAYLVSGRKS